MIKKLVKHGADLALIMDCQMLELLGVTDETRFDVSTDGQVIKIIPVQDTDRRESFEAALNKVNEKYKSALKKLS